MRRAPTLSARDRRTLLAGITCVLGLLVVSRALPAWRAWVRDTHDSAMELSGQLAIARQDAAGDPARRHAADSLEQVYLRIAPATLDGDTPARAAAALATYVTDAAHAAGVRLGTVQLAVDSADTAASGRTLYRVHVVAQATGDIEGVTGLLRAVESSATPLLSIRRVSISQADPAAPDRVPETLSASFEIEGVARRDIDP